MGAEPDDLRVQDRMPGLVPDLAGPVRVNRPSGYDQSGAAEPHCLASGPFLCPRRSRARRPRAATRGRAAISP